MSDSKDAFEAVIEFLRLKFAELFRAIDQCVSAKLMTPALVLVYSGIDVAAWLDCANPEKIKTGQRFVSWVSKYLPLGDELKCNALELFGARCGLVHNFSSESDLSRAGKIRQIHYAWGSSMPETLQELNDLTQMDGYVAIKLELLIIAFKKGLESFFDDSENNPAKARRITERAGKTLKTMSDAELQALLALGKRLVANV
ncbi:MAG: hypothetical protein ACLQDV_21200 [Candidatus Binataceae bacterium]